MRMLCVAVALLTLGAVFPLDAHASEKSRFYWITAGTFTLGALMLAGGTYMLASSGQCTEHYAGHCSGGNPRFSDLPWDLQAETISFFALGAASVGMGIWLLSDGRLHHWNHPEHRAQRPTSAWQPIVSVRKDGGFAGLGLTF